MLTNKGKYGLKAMLHLAGAEEGQPILAAEIAAAENIPKKFLDAILGDLRMASLVHSKKGRGGGFVLAKSAAQIRVGQIVRALDGMLAPIACASKGYYRRCEDCDKESQCRVRLMMSEVRNAISSVLDQRTLEDMKSPEVAEPSKPRKRPTRKAASDKPEPAKRAGATAAKALR